MEGFLERNKDSLPDSVVEAVKLSSLRLVRTLFVRRSEQPVGSQIRKSAMPKRWVVCVGCVATELNVGVYKH